MRNVKRALTVGVTAVAIAATTAVPAQAASVGGSCKLSANWPVKFSATYDQPGNNSYLRYVVMNSPGAINQLRVTVKDRNGANLGIINVVNPAKVTRVDIEASILFPRVLMEVWGGNGACGKTLYPYSV